VLLGSALLQTDNLFTLGLRGYAKGWSISDISFLHVLVRILLSTGLFFIAFARPFRHLCRNVGLICPDFTRNWGKTLPKKGGEKRRVEKTIRMRNMPETGCPLFTKGRKRSWVKSNGTRKQILNNSCLIKEKLRNLSQIVAITPIRSMAL